MVLSGLCPVMSDRVRESVRLCPVRVSDRVRNRVRNHVRNVRACPETCPDCPIMAQAYCSAASQRVCSKPRASGLRFYAVLCARLARRPEARPTERGWGVLGPWVPCRPVVGHGRVGVEEPRKQDKSAGLLQTHRRRPQCALSAVWWRARIRFYAVLCAWGALLG